MVAVMDEKESYEVDRVPLLEAAPSKKYGAALEAAVVAVGKPEDGERLEHFGHSHEVLNPLLVGKPLRLVIQVLIFVASCLGTVSFADKQIRQPQGMYEEMEMGIAHEANELVESMYCVTACCLVFLPTVFFSVASMFAAFKNLRKQSRAIHWIEYISVMVPIIIQATPLLAFAIDVVLCHGLTFVDIHVLEAFAIFGSAFVGHPAEAAFLTLLFRLSHCVEERARSEAMNAEILFDELAPKHASVLHPAIADRLYDLATADHASRTSVTQALQKISGKEMAHSDDHDQISEVIRRQLRTISEASTTEGRVKNRRKLPHTLGDIGSSKSIARLGEMVDFWKKSDSFSLDALGSLPSAAWSNPVVGSVQPGTVVRVKDGELVPLKSLVLPGNGLLRVTQSHVDGETAPSDARAGKSLAAGSTLVEGGPAYVVVTHTDDEGEVGQMRNILKEASENKPKLTSFFDIVSSVYSKLMIAVFGLIVLGLPKLPGKWKVPRDGPNGSIMRGLAFIVAGAPCALVLVTPIAYWSMYTACMRESVTLAQLRVIDDMASITDVIFDKTGTLTTNMVMPEALAINPITFESTSSTTGPLWVPDSSNFAAGTANKTEKSEAAALTSLLRIASVVYVLENEISKQPHAVAARRWAEEVLSAHSVTLVAGDNVPATSHDQMSDQDRSIQISKTGKTSKDERGRGISATVIIEGRSYSAAVGAPAFVAETLGLNSQQVMAKLKSVERLRGISLAGALEVLPDGSKGALDIQVLLFRDELRRGAVEAVKRLQKMGITVHIASGDRQSRVLDVAKAVGVDPANVKANVSPGDKLALVKNLGKDGRVVSMVGDEINDAGAMVASAVGVAIGDVASPFVSSSDVAKVIINENSLTKEEADLVKLAASIEQARWSRWIVAENLIIAGLGLLVVAPAAVASKIPFWLAVIGHEGGTLLVAFNSVRLLKMHV